MLQIVELCRLCAQKKRSRVDLFANSDEESNLLIGKIFFCLSVNITRQDILPKMICFDCQRSVEQFHAFRTKCQKAEERLNKMLSLNKMVTSIKQECTETDFDENYSLQSYADLSKQNESLSFLNLKTLKNVKSEVVDADMKNPNTHFSGDGNSDLIQIISEEIVNHNLVDVKQPVIEIVSENFLDDYKDEDITYHESDVFCDTKLSENCEMSESTTDEQIFYRYTNLDAKNKSVDPTALIEVKMQPPDSECEQPQPLSPTADSTKVNQFSKKVKTHREPNVHESKLVRSNKNIKKRKKRKDLVESDVEIDPKYLFLGDDEECNIDMEELEAIIKKKIDPNSRFECKKCKKSFKFLKCLKNHRTLHENEPEAFICYICCNNNAKNFEFSNLKCLKSHFQLKHLVSRQEKFQCHLCSRILTSQGQLNAHYRKVHDNSGASCQVCGKSFKNKNRLTDHLRVHKEDRPYICDQCGQTFKWNNCLKVHMQAHKREKNFLCSECGKKFSAKKNLLEHLNIHTGKRPHVCPHCNATFIQLSAYSKHLYIHKEELKLHKCDKCDKSFSHGYLLKQHKFQHSDLRPYTCSVCRNSFKSQSDLCTHVKIHQEKQYACTVCGRKFSRSKTLKDHMVRHTGIKHICPAPGCGKSYTQRFPLTKHFCKNHPTLMIINRTGGKKAHFGDKLMNDQENYPHLDFIHYDCRSKDEMTVLQSIPTRNFGTHNA